MKNALLKFFCKILPIPKHPSKNRFLIVSTTALGDTLWATPAIESLRKSFPNGYIGVLTSAIGFDVLKTNPSIDQIFLLKKNYFTLWKALYQKKFDTVLVLHASQRITLPLCAILGARRIIGTAGINKGLDSLLTDPLKPAYEHEILRRLRMVEKVGGQIHTETLSFFPEESSECLPPGKWIALHPGSKDPFKRWPARHFITVGKELQKQGYRLLITGTEKDLITAIASQIPDAVVLGHKNLHTFANILKQVHLLISNDTGPVHLACALHVPVLAIYGPTDPHLCGPHTSKNGTIFYTPPTCTPCLKRKCRTPFCFLQISPAQVTKSALRHLNPIS
jgi:ADP-heptose:LPS heptosyltransferase